jgi:hypothetical protein
VTKQLSRGHRISKTRMHPADEHVDREVGDLLDEWIRDHDSEAATPNDDLLLINAGVLV